jgi:hypothetical protein
MFYNFLKNKIIFDQFGSFKNRIPTMTTTTVAGSRRNVGRRCRRADVPMTSRPTPRPTTTTTSTNTKSPRRRAAKPRRPPPPSRNPSRSRKRTATPSTSRSTAGSVSPTTPEIWTRLRRTSSGCAPSMRPELRSGRRRRK